MSAPREAVPLKEENPNWIKAGLGTFTCNSCGHEDIGYELLCVEDNDTLWCPQCGSTEWIWD